MKSRAKGRYWIIFWLALFLGTASLVVARQKAALDVATDLRKLREDRVALEARRADLERRIRVGSSIGVILPKVSQSAGLGMPADSQYTRLGVSPAPNRPSR
jgi:hypothetical protein